MENSCDKSHANRPFPPHNNPRRVTTASTQSMPTLLHPIRVAQITTQTSGGHHQTATATIQSNVEYGTRIERTPTIITEQRATTTQSVNVHGVVLATQTHVNKAFAQTNTHKHSHIAHMCYISRAFRHIYAVTDTTPRSIQQNCGHTPLVEHIAPYY